MHCAVVFRTSVDIPSGPQQSTKTLWHSGVSAMAARTKVLTLGR